MITLKDFFGMTPDTQRIAIDYDDTVTYHRVYEGFNLTSNNLEDMASIKNEYIKNANQYVVVIMAAVNNILNVVIMDKSEYENEVKRNKGI
jgi:hypothetical protein